MILPEATLDITLYTPSLDHENYKLTKKRLAQVSLCDDSYSVVDYSCDEASEQYVASRSKTAYYHDVYTEALCSCGKPEHTERWYGFNPKRIKQLAEIVADLEEWPPDRREVLANSGSCL